MFASPAIRIADHASGRFFLRTKLISDRDTEGGGGGCEVEREINLLFYYLR
jgi:hypothetical protein